MESVQQSPGVASIVAGLTVQTLILTSLLAAGILLASSSFTLTYGHGLTCHSFFPI